MKGTHNDKKRENRGFYIALGACLIAVGIAAWATFDSVSKITGSYGDELVSESSQSVEEDALPKDSEEPSKTETEETDDTAPSDDGQETKTQTEEPAGNEEEEPAQQTVLTVDQIDFQAPLKNGITVSKAFSGDELVYSETMKDYRVHNGVDLKANRGDTVQAMADGEVTSIYQDELWGNVIEITHGEAVVSYCGLGDTALVQAGDTVKAGQDIGSITETPCENIETPHLHLMVQVNGAWIDPMTLLPGE